MNSVRIGIVALAAALLAACSSAPSKPAAPAVANVAGVWTVNTETQMGPMETKLTVSQTGKDLKGVLEGPMGNADCTGAVEGNTVKFGFDFDAQGAQLRIDYMGELEGADSMKGKVSFGSFGEGTFTAKKNP